MLEDNTLIINNIQFDDLNESEQIKISMQIGISQNPKLRVLRIARGNELDSENMKIVKEFARKNNCQIWIQRVSDERQEGIFIDDGEILNSGDIL